MEAEAEPDGLTEAETETDGLIEAEADNETETEGLIDADSAFNHVTSSSLNVTSSPWNTNSFDGEGDVDTDGLIEAD